MQEHRRKEEERLAVEERYSSLEEEAAAVGKKLKQLWAKFRAAQVCHSRMAPHTSRSTFLSPHVSRA